ncbi:MAG: hypothetical protein L0229_02580 [Blastocatellia bacterium]|nr:hypothetical protein [Blastocatellia bacterium]
MISINKKLLVATMGLLLMLATAMPASADHRRRGRSSGTSTKEKVAYIGGGAAAGAIIGGLLGGKKGALIGGAIGAGAGTGTVLIKDRRDDDDFRFRRNRRFIRNNRRFIRNDRRFIRNDGRFIRNNRARRW